MKLYIVYNQDDDEMCHSFIVRCSNKKEAVDKTFDRCHGIYPKRCFEAYLLEDCFNDEKEYGWNDIIMFG